MGADDGVRRARVVGVLWPLQKAPVFPLHLHGECVQEAFSKGDGSSGSGRRSSCWKGPGPAGHAWQPHLQSQSSRKAVGLLSRGGVRPCWLLHGVWSGSGCVAVVRRDGGKRAREGMSERRVSRGPGSAHFFLTVNILGFVGRRVCHNYPTCHCSRKAAIDSM